jgi:hypothetical protein
MYNITDCKIQQLLKETGNGEKSREQKTSCAATCNITQSTNTCLNANYNKKSINNKPLTTIKNWKNY